MSAKLQVAKICVANLTWHKRKLQTFCLLIFVDVGVCMIILSHCEMQSDCFNVDSM